MSDTVRKTLNRLPHLIFTITLWSRFFLYSFFPERETKTWGGKKLVSHYSREAGIWVGLCLLSPESEGAFWLSPRPPAWMLQESHAPELDQAAALSPNFTDFADDCRLKGPECKRVRDPGMKTRLWAEPSSRWGVTLVAPVLYLSILVRPKGTEAWETLRQNIELKRQQNNGIIRLSKGTQANCNLARLCMELKFVSANHTGIIIKKKPRPWLAMNWTLATHTIIF